MSFDSRIGVTQSYKVPLKLENDSKSVINNALYKTTDLYLSLENTKHTVSSRSSDFICDYITAEHKSNSSVKDKSVPTMDDRYYLLKTGSTYLYEKEKPFTYDNEMTRTKFLSIADRDIRDTDVAEMLEKSIKATRGMIQSRGTTKSSWVAFSFPFGGISTSTPLFFYVNNFKVKTLLSGADVKLDLLEGIVYIKQSFYDKVEQVFGYFDIEPLKIHKSDYLTISGKTEETFGKFNQKSLFGDITVNQITDDSYILTLSYNAFIVSSDPYFIAVDGVNLLNPRYVEKHTPIFVEQRFNKERESFLESYLKLFNGVESEEVNLMTTFIKNDSSVNQETFSKINSSSGLFIYKEVASNCFDTTNATYLPLFNPQDIVREQEQ